MTKGVLMALFSRVKAVSFLLALAVLAGGVFAEQMIDRGQNKFLRRKGHD